MPSVLDWRQMQRKQLHHDLKHKDTPYCSSSKLNIKCIMFLFTDICHIKCFWQYHVVCAQSCVTAQACSHTYHGTRQMVWNHLPADCCWLHDMTLSVAPEQENVTFFSMLEWYIRYVFFFVVVVVKCVINCFWSCASFYQNSIIFPGEETGIDRILCFVTGAYSALVS